VSEDPRWPRAADWLASGGDPGGPHLVVAGVPCARSSISPSRADTTPSAVRRALRRFSTFDADLDVDLERLRVTDVGDLPVSALAGHELLRAITSGLEELPPAGLVVLVGGDNALTRPAAGVLLPDLRRGALLTLDAHHDVRELHAGPTNGTPVRGLLQDGLPGGQVVQVGLGALTNSRAYRTWCDERGITVVTASAARRRGVGEVVRSALDQLAARADAVYVDLDVDVVDSSQAPGCPGGRPGGLAAWELLDAAAEAGRHPALVAVDVVEVDALADAGRTVDLAAACLLRVAAGFAARVDGRAG
jgi:formiminoglutamase